MKKLLKNENSLNVICAFFLQITAIISGFFVSKIILISFGSEVNGLVSSINQFLSVISLLEGGLTAVVLSQLYKPIEERDTDKISAIVAASNHFFQKVAIIFTVYSVILSVIYPLIVKQKLSFQYICTLILIISLTTFAQYFFSITNRIVLQGNQKNYIISITMGVSYLLNLGFAAIAVQIYPSIHILKLFNAILFCLQPLVYKHFVQKYFDIKKVKCLDHGIIKNRWSGLYQNLTYFITMNTDMIVLTLFSTLSEVSVYSVYMLVLNAIRQLITSTAGGYQSVIGKAIAHGDDKELQNTFDKFVKVTSNVSVLVFGITLILIVPFVRIYTWEVKDANYIQYAFAFVMVLAQLVFCVREPYRLLVLSAGKFKETNRGAIIEAILNLGISLLLVSKFGLFGVALGTFVATTYRYIYFLWYINRHMLKIGKSKAIKEHFFFGLEILGMLVVSNIIGNQWIRNYGYFIIAGIFYLVIFGGVQIAILLSTKEN